MKTTNIKGKEYVEVAERVKYFRQTEDYKGWSIKTELISNENGICVFKAEVLDNDGVLKASGHAYEKENASFINKTSYIENCETSAVGRALGFLGIGIDASIASADEIQNAMENQTKRVDDIVVKKDNVGVDFDVLKEKYKTMTTEELRTEYAEVLNYQGWTPKQRNAVCKMIIAEQKGRE